MNEYDVKRLALIFAMRAEIEGMKAENENRKQNNYAMAYVAEDFQDKAEDLRNIAHAHNDQLFG